MQNCVYYLNGFRTKNIFPYYSSFTKYLHFIFLAFNRKFYKYVKKYMYFSNRIYFDIFKGALKEWIIVTMDILIKKSIKEYISFHHPCVQYDRRCTLRQLCWFTCSKNGLKKFNMMISWKPVDSFLNKIQFLPLFVLKQFMFKLEFALLKLLDHSVHLKKVIYYDFLCL